MIIWLSHILSTMMLLTMWQNLRLDYLFIKSEYKRKKSTPRAKLIASNCWVSMVGLRNIFWTVRGWTWMRSASHSLVCPCRRSSSRIICPMFICIKKPRVFFVGTRGSGLPINPNKEARDYSRAFRFFPGLIANTKWSRFRVLLLKAKTLYYVYDLLFILLSYICLVLNGLY